MALQVRYGTQERGEHLLLLVHGPPRPHRWSHHDPAADEERKGVVQ
jgi:hypothetical protein